MKQYLLSATFITLAFLSTSGTAKAIPFAVNYNFSAGLGVYPSDDPPSGNQYRFSGSGRGIIDVDASTYSIGGTNSTLAFGPGLAELRGTSSDQFSFSIDVDLDSELALGVHEFNLSLKDFIEQGYGSLDVPGGTGLRSDGSVEPGFSQLPTFDVSGSYTVSMISTVPLPASAPMFGTAVLALGLAGYGMRRQKAAAAA